MFPQGTAGSFDRMTVLNGSNPYSRTSHVRSVGFDPSALSPVKTPRQLGGADGCGMMARGGVADNLGMLTYVPVYAALPRPSAPCLESILHTRMDLLSSARVFSALSPVKTSRQSGGAGRQVSSTAAVKGNLFVMTASPAEKCSVLSNAKRVHPACFRPKGIGSGKCACG